MANIQKTDGYEGKGEPELSSVFFMGKQYTLPIRKPQVDEIILYC